MRTTTLLFPVKRKEGQITEVCLAMKKRGFGAGRWNGAGGKLQEGEDVHQAAIRETKEEIGIDAGELVKIAELTFAFQHKSDWNQICHVFFVESWSGDPVESEEMKPQWFSVADIPFESMWPDDIHWLPLVLQGKKLHAEFLFGEQDEILDKKIEEVNI